MFDRNLTLASIINKVFQDFLKHQECVFCVRFELSVQYRIRISQMVENDLVLYHASKYVVYELVKVGFFDCRRKTIRMRQN